MENFFNNLSDEARELLLNELLFNDLIGVNITDKDGNVLFLNDSHTRITGHPKSLYLGRNMKDLEDKGAVSQSATLEVLKIKKDVIMHQKNESGKNFKVRSMPVFNKKGEMCFVLNLLTDITELTTTKEKITEIEEYNQFLKKVLDKESSLIYQSRIMQQVVELSHKVAEADVTVLITGPSGVGKEHIADIIHENSKRRHKPFVKINCAAMPENLLESELFGYEPGAFTGGNPKGKKGLFEVAQGGSIMLDEIGELPMVLQPKLLRVLQEREIRRIGGSKPIKVDFRLISATNVNLKEKIEEKQFREDLYYRLNIIEIKIPALEDRREDIPLLADHFIKLFNAKYSLHKTLDIEAVKYLCQCSWPGNVRELRNVVERLIIQSSHDVISAKEAYEAMGMLKIKSGNQTVELDEASGDVSLKEMMENYEKKILEEYIKIYKTGTELSKRLKTDQSTISRKLSKYNISY